MALTKAHNRMIEGAAVNVKDYGAVGDNSSDDTASIQACIDAVEASTYGGVVFFPAGIYKITSALTVSDKKVSIKGEGAEASVISALSCNGINFNSGSYDRGTSFVEDIGLEGRTGSAANFAGIESILPPGGVSGTDSRDGLHFHRVKLFNFNQGFIISDTWEWSIKGCKFQKVTNPISLGNYSMVGRIVDNYMVYENGDDFSGTANAYGIDFSGTIHEGIVIRGNQMNKFERCINIPQATFVSITENDFDGTSYGIHISAAEGGCNIENNYFAITTASAKGIFGAAQATTIRALVNVRGNHFEATAPATGSVGIEINTVGATNQWNWRIKDNNFRGLASFDILSYNSGDLLVEGNRCQSTGTTHSISINDVSSSAPCYIRNNICENTINVTASDVANGDVILTDNYANGAKDYGNAFKDQIALVDGITAPSTLAGYAQLYVDTADGDLKIRFGDGTVKTIVVDT